VNAFGQRIRKTNSLGDTVFGYDQGGRLLAEIRAATGEDYLYPMNGTTILPTEGYVRTVADLSWRVAGTGDFDGDGRGDILWRNFTSGDNYIYFMNGTTISAEGYIRTVADLNWKIVATGDFNGDGKSDIFWRNSATGETYVYLMNGLTISAEGYLLTVADQSWQVAGVGDFDGDGKSDVLWRNSSSGENYIYFMDGTTVSTAGYIRTVADLNWRIAGTGKFDADTKSDIFWHNSATGETYLYPMDGLTIKPTEGYIRTVSTIGWQVKGVADLDGDARADVVWRNAITGENYLWPMEGLAIKSSEGYFRQVELSWQIAAIRDYDGDGKADIFWRRGQDQQPSREYVYLGDMPVGVFLSGSPIAHYIHVDHLNTPRLVANQQGQTVWRWDQQEPFGVNVPDENPSALGVFEFPLRFPGQYADKETNLYYNYFRDCYDPVLGRYCQSDPIGLEGGINTYSYVESSPLDGADPLGLDSGLGLSQGPPATFLTTTTLASAQRGYTLSQAVQAGSLFRNFTAPMIMAAGAPYVGAIAGPGLAPLSSAASTAYMCAVPMIRPVAFSVAMFAQGAQSPSKAISTLNKIISTRQTVQQIQQASKINPNTTPKP